MPKPWERDWDTPLEGVTPEQSDEILAADRSGEPFHFTVENGAMTRRPMPWEREWDTPGGRARARLDELDIPGPTRQAPVGPVVGEGLAALLEDDQAAFGFHPQIERAPAGPQQPAAKRTGSVTDTITPREPAVDDFGAPVTAQTFGEIERAMKAMTPDERARTAEREDWRGAVARKVLERWGEPLPTMKKIMGRREDIYEQDIREGASRETAERRARLNAGAPEGLDATGSARVADFDFDTAARYKDASALERGVAKGREMLSQSGGGILKFAAEVAGVDPAGVDATLAQIQRRTEAIGENQSSNALARHFENAVSSMVLNVPGLAYGAVTGAAAVPLLVMSAQVFGQEYDEGRRKGLSPGDAAARGAAFGVAEAIGERVGMPTFLKTFQAATKGVPTEELMGLLAKHTAREIPGELLTTTLQFSTDKFAPMGLAPEAGLKDYLTQMGDTLVQTVMQAGTMTGAAIAPNAFALHQRGRAQGRADMAEASAMEKWATQGLVRRGIESAEFTPEGLAAVVADPASRKMAVDKWREEGFAAQKEAMGEPAEPLEPQAGEQPEVPAGLSALLPIDEGRAIEKMQAQADADAFAVKADSSREVQQARGAVEDQEKGARVVGYAKDGNAAARAAASLTRETGRKHSADTIGGKWVVVEDSAEPAPSVDAAAHEAATSPKNDLPEPTDAQKAAGNYKKGHETIAGMDVSIENPAGSTRSGTDANGKRWESRMNTHYGYVKGTVGFDKDHLDVVVKPGTSQGFDGTVFVVNQDKANGHFDEHKAVIGAATEEEAKGLYLSNYEKGWEKRIRSIVPMPMADFKAWAYDKSTSGPKGGELKGKAPETKATGITGLSFVMDGGSTAPVSDVAEAQRRWVDFRDRAMQLRAGEELPRGGVVVDASGKMVARISYNGRVTTPDGKEITTVEQARALTAKEVSDEGAVEVPAQPAVDDAAGAATAEAPDGGGVAQPAEPAGPAEASERPVGATEAPAPVAGKDGKPRIWKTEKQAALWLKNNPREGYSVQPAEGGFMVGAAAPAEPPSTPKQEALKKKMAEKAAAEEKARAEREAAKAAKEEEKKAAKDVKERAQAKREAEREAWTAALDLPAVIDNANATDFSEKARAAIEGWYDKTAEDAKASGDTKRATAMLAAKAAIDAKLLEVLQIEAKKVAAKQELERNRDPEVHDNAFRAAFAKYGVGDNPEAGAAFVAGWNHMLAGKTRSTLSGDFMGTRSAGYDAAKDWIRNGEGKAWYEGKRAKKLENTGADLRRWWEQAKKAVNEAPKGSVEAAWKAIEASTERGKVFAPRIPENASPGATRFINDIRNEIIPIKEHLKEVLLGRNWDSSTDTFEDRLRGFARSDNASQDDLAKRVERLQEAVNVWLDMIGAFADDFDGAATVKEIAERAGKIPDDRKNKLRSSYTYFMRRGEFNRLFERDYYINQRVKEEQDADRESSRKTPLIPPRLDFVERVNVPDRREGRDISPKEFKEAFGFADVGFGKWVGSQQDKDHLNYAYDAFMDLADQLGIKPKDISLGGTLHFTIGALGHGKHAAHYSPNQPHPDGGTVPVINVTNTKGDGTLAHEWHHALDYHIQNTDPDGYAGVKRLVKALKEQANDPDGFWVDQAMRFLKHGSYWTHRRREWTPLEHAQYALDDRGSYLAEKSSATTTKFYKDAQALDGPAEKPYWSNDRELLARSAEAWVWDRLGEKRNTYLVNPWVKDGTTKPPKYRGTPYPEGEERARLNALYDSLYKAMTWGKGGPKIDVSKLDIPDAAAALEAARKRVLANLPAMWKEIELEKKMVIVAAKQAEADTARERAEAARRKAEEEEAARRAAEEALRAPPPEPSGELTDDELSAMFDEAAASLRESTQESPKAPTPGTNALEAGIDPQKPSMKAPPADKPLPPAAVSGAAAKMAAEAAKLGVEGIDEALTGLTKLFGGPGRLNSFPGGFDEEVYRQAKPHFEACLTKFQDAGKTLKDLFAYLIQQFGEGIKAYAIQFAKDKGLTAQLSGDSTPEMKIAKWVVTKLTGGEEITWQQLFEQGDRAFGGTQADGRYTPKDAYDAVEAGVNLYLREGNWTATGTADDAARDVKNLSRMLDLIPTQTKRTAEMDEFQQFSTPPTHSYVVNWVANLRSTDQVMEPSAGIGGLAIYADNFGAGLVLNELSKRRAGILRSLFPNAQHFSEDAAQIHNIMPASVSPTVVLMNPPFSATAGRVTGKRDTMEGARHIEQALKRLATNGRLVAIVGEGMGADKPAFREWWTAIKKVYNVRANIGIDGRGYAKYGTTFDNQILVIDKDGPTQGDVLTGKVADVAELPALLEEIRNDRPESRSQALATGEDAQPNADQPAGGQPAAGGVAGSGNAQRPGAVPVAGAGGGAGGRIPAGGGKRGGDAGQAGGNAPAGGDGLPDPLGQRRSDADEPAGRPGGSGDRAGAGARGQDGGDRAVSGAKIEATETRQSGALTDSIYEQYTPQRLRVPGAKPHPGALVQSSAMAAVLPPPPAYTPNLPKEVVDQGMLSLAQIEAVVYAGQAHSQMLPNGERRGFLIGDGTGVGKGREIAGILLDNWRQGRRKAVWLSEKQGLMKDAQRDFSGVSGDPALIHNQNKTKAGKKLEGDEGIIFSTYATLRSGSQEQADEKGKKAGKSRIDQLEEWLGKDFDGVIVFDEAHNMGNAIAVKGRRGNTKPSEQALAGVELQRRFPKARVVYVSATAATEVYNLTYANRLGLWGEATAFSTVADFVNKVSAAGVAAMELVARDMKAIGAYLARSLSFDGVRYDRTTHELSGLQRDSYNRMAEAWQTVLQNVNDALEETKQKKNGRAKGAAMSKFWGSHQRFFNQLITSMQMPTVIAQAERDLAEGKSVVFQLVNTNEAEQERQAAERRRKQDEGDEEEEDLEFGPMDGLINFVRTAFPVAQYHEEQDENGNVKTVPTLTADGTPVINQDMVEKRERLISDLEQIGKSNAIPGNPIDLLVEAFGADMVAEVTGRKRRFVKERDKDSYKTVEQRRGKAAVDADATAFMDGKKRVLVFSDAGGTGFSFHADNTKGNRQPRRHYLVQPGWRADKAVQGFGRTHRTNQAQPPEYVLVTTDLKAQKRFISSIARRLDQLGALTKGERKTASQGLFTAADNLESGYAVDALRQFLMDVYAGRVEGLDFDDMSRQMGLDMIDPKTGALSETKLPSIPQFLNRLLSLNIDTQGKVFDEFAARMEDLVQRAIENGTFDDGMQTIKAQKITKVSEDQVYSDPKTGAETKYVELELTHPTRFNAWEEVDRRANFAPKEFSGYYRDNRSGAVFMVIRRGRRVDARGVEYTKGERWEVSGERKLIENVDHIEAKPEHQQNVVKKIVGPTYQGPTFWVEVEGRKYESGPVAHQFNTQPIEKVRAWIESERKHGTAARAEAQEKILARIEKEAVEGDRETRLPHYEKLDEKEAKALWERQTEEAPKTYTETVHLISGATLPIWDRFPEGQTQVARAQTEDGERFLGRVVPPKALKETLKRLGVNAAKKVTTPELMKRILSGQIAVLSNGWMLKRKMVSQDYRIEIVSPRALSAGDERVLKNQGAIMERIGWQERFFVPTDDAAVLERILAGKTVVELEGGDEPLPSRPAPESDIRHLAPEQKVDRRGVMAYGNSRMIFVLGRDRIDMGDGTYRISYNLHDPREPNERGRPTLVGSMIVAMDEEEGKFRQIRNIEILKAYRKNGSGHGEAAVAMILAHNGATPVEVINIQHAGVPEDDDALPFWRAMGVDLYNYSSDPNVDMDGRILPDRYLQALSRRGKVWTNGTLTRHQEAPRAAQGSPAQAGASDGAGTAAGPRGREGSGPALRQRAPREEVGSGLSREAVREIVKALGSDAEVLTTAELPPQLAAWVKKNDPAGVARGLFDPASGAIYVFHDRVSSPELAAFVALHESAHRGLRRLFGPDLDPVLREIYKANANVKTRANLRRAKYKETIERATEEVIADMARQGQAKNLKGWEKFVALVRNWLAERGFSFAWTDDMVEFLAGAAAEAGKTSEPTIVTEQDAQRLNLEAPKWYSELAAKIAQAKQEVAPAAQWKAWLKNQPGVKADEIEWSGVNEWLDTQVPKVTKAAVLDYLRGNGVKVDEVALGDTAGEAREVSFQEAQRLLRERGDAIKITNQYDGRIYPDRMDMMHPAQRYFAQEVSEATKFSSYQLPGGTNYRELLLTLPENKSVTPAAVNRDAWAVEDVQYNLEGGNGRMVDTKEWTATINGEDFRIVYNPHKNKYVLSGGRGYRIQNAHNDTLDEAMLRAQSGPEMMAVGAAGAALRGEFRSSHFDTPNILAHVRFNERTDAEGRRILFLEEIQSDWAQKGKKQGFVNPEKRADIERRIRALGITKPLSDVSLNDLIRARADADLENDFNDHFLRGFDNIPAAPFVGKTEAWVGLAVKRMVRYAVDNGFDGIAWTTGEQQADRYSLRHQVDKIEWITKVGTTDTLVGIDTKKGQVRLVVDKDGLVTGSDQHAGQPFVDRRLEDVIGKGAAEKIMGNHKGSLEGDGLNIGGEGMAAFYDRIVPNVANDILKKMGGGRVGAVEFGGMTGRARNPYTVLEVGTGYFVEGGGERIGPFAVEEQAKVALADILAKRESRTQPGFYLTPAMKEKAAEGMPMFSRAKDDKTIAGRVAQLRGGGGKITDRLTDMVVSDKSFNFWHKSVGTQYHKAMVNAEFRRVFKKGQDYLHEFSRAALDAADQAPTLLPKLEGFRDIPRSIFAGAAKKDVQAAGRAILEGTLYDESADPFKGRVFSDAELADMGLTDKQVSLYREARAAIDASLDLLHASEVAMLARNPAREVGGALERPARPLPGLPAALALAKKDPGRAGEIVGDYLAKQAEKIDEELSGMTFAGGTGSKKADALKAEKRRLLDLATTLVDKQDQKDRLKAAGYAPLQRFGDHTVSVHDEDGELVYYSMHESQREANAVKRQIEHDPEFAGMDVRSGIKSRKAYTLYRGLTPDTLELFATTLGIGQDSVFQAYLKVAKNDRSAFKRMIHRQGVQGFQTDLTRSLASFITSNARAVAGNWHMGELVQAADEVSAGDVKDEAADLVNYLQAPQEEAAFFRSLLFMNYLGGSVAAGLVNMTQPLTMTLPYLGQWGNAQASKELGRAMRDALKSPDGLEKGLAGALHRGIEEGIVAPHEVHQLHAEAMRNMGSNLAWRKVMTAWGSLFSATEAFNRRVTFISAYRTADRIGASNPYQFAVRAVEETQGIYNRGNRPNWARGAIGATLFTFRQFAVSYVELLKRLPPRQRLVALAVMFLAAGMQGLPFAEDLEDLLDTLAQRLGYSWNTKQEARRALARVLGNTGAEFVMHGASHLPGVPLDVQGRLGMGNLIPGSSVGKLNANAWREATDALGAAGAFAKGVATAAGRVVEGDFSGAAEELMPVAFKNIMKAVDMMQTGMYRDTRGRKVMDTTPTDAAMKLVGFQPQRVAKESKKIGEQMQNIGLHRIVEGRIADKMAEARFERMTAKDDGQRRRAGEKLDDARKELTRWNLKNPDAKIVIEPSQIDRRVREMRLTRSERLVKRAPKEIRGDVRGDLE